MKIDLSAALTRSTNDADTYSAAFVFDHNIRVTECGWHRQRTRVRLNPSYDSKRKQGGAPVITRAYSGTLQHLVYLPNDNRYFLSGNARYLSNNALGVYLQQTYSVELGTLVTVGRIAMEFEVGPAAVGLHYINAQSPNRLPSRAFAASVFAERTSIPLSSSLTPPSLTQNVRLVQPLQGGEPTQMYAFVGLEVPVVKHLAFNVRAQNDYLSITPVGTKKAYFTTTAGLTLTAGRAVQ